MKMETKIDDFIISNAITSVFMGVHKENKSKVFTNFLWGCDGSSEKGCILVVKEEEKKVVKKHRVFCKKLQ